MNTQAALFPGDGRPDIRRNAQHETLGARIAAVDWDVFEQGLTLDGYAMLPAMLVVDQCREVASYFLQDDRFRSRIVMERYAFGRGEYKYFAEPLPDVVGQLRQMLYSYLAPIANRWHAAMRIEARFPATIEEFRAMCGRAGQRKPTPLLLRYHEGDYCCLHQDLYGEHVFPFQAVFLLDEPGRDFEGGEFLLAGSDPRKPGRAEVVPLKQGDGVILATNHHPVRGTRGVYRAALRHGVSKLHRGERHTLGIIFHDAR